MAVKSAGRAPSFSLHADIRLTTEEKSMVKKLKSG
jgi:hypothetical protein